MFGRPEVKLPPNLLSEGLVIYPEVILPNSDSPEETHQNLQHYLSSKIRDFWDVTVLMGVLFATLRKIVEHPTA
jgi:hypothetical protein